jgi:hypothetical protein
MEGRLCIFFGVKGSYVIISERNVKILKRFRRPERDQYMIFKCLATLVSEEGLETLNLLNGELRNFDVRMLESYFFDSYGGIVFQMATLNTRKREIGILPCSKGFIFNKKNSINKKLSPLSLCVY